MTKTIDFDSFSKCIYKIFEFMPEDGLKTHVKNLWDQNSERISMLFEFQGSKGLKSFKYKAVEQIIKNEIKDDLDLLKQINSSKLFSFLKNLMNSNYREVLEFLKKPELIGEAHRASLAETMLDLHPHMFGCNFAVFNIDFEKHPEVMEKFLEKQPCVFARNFNIFNVDSSQHLICAEKLLEKCDADSVDTIVRCLRNFTIDSAGHLRLAKQILYRYPWLLVKNLTKFKIDLDGHLEIVKELLKEDGGCFSTFSSYILNVNSFSLGEHEYAILLKKLLENKLLVKKHTTTLACYFKLFNIDSAEHSVWAEKIFEKDPKTLADHFEKFNIDPAEYSVWAEKIFEKDPKTLADHFEKFNIDPSEHFAWAEKIFEKNPKALANHFEKFNIDAAQHSILATRFLENDSEVLADHWEKFNIADSLIWAEKILDKNPHALVFNLEKFNKDSVDHSILAEKFFEKDPRVLARYWRQFKINSKGKAAWAEKIFEKDPSALALYMENFITNLGDWSMWADRLLKRDPGALVHNLSTFIDFDRYAELFDELLERDLNALAYNFEKLKLFVSCFQHDKLVNKLLEREPFALAVNFQKFYIASDKYLMWARKILEKDPHVMVENFKNFNVLDPRDRASRIERLVFMGDLILLSSGLEVNERDLLRTAWIQSLQDGSSILKKSKHLKKLYSFLDTLMSLPPSERVFIFQHIFFEPMTTKIEILRTDNKLEKKLKIDKNQQLLSKHNSKYVNKITFLTALILWGKSKQIVEKGSKISLIELQLLSISALKDFLGHDEHGEQFYADFMKLFKRLRAGQTIFTYSSILNYSEKPEHLIKKDDIESYETFKKCCVSLVKNEFSSWRMNTAHLNKLKNSGFGNLLEKWSQGIVKSAELEGEKYKGWRFVDTADFSQLMLMGRDTGGCLNIDGGKNREYLIGHLADGKIRLFGFENQNNELIIRMSAHFLWGNKSKKPVLLLTNPYTLNGNKTFLQEALLKFSIIRAQELGLPLITLKESSGGWIEETSLKSLSLKSFEEEARSFSTNGCREYVDPFFRLYGDGHAKTNGIYSIPAGSCVILYDPEEEGKAPKSPPSLILDGSTD